MRTASALDEAELRRVRARSDRQRPRDPKTRYSHTPLHPVYTGLREFGISRSSALFKVFVPRAAKLRPFRAFALAARPVRSSGRRSFRAARPARTHNPLHQSHLPYPNHFFSGNCAFLKPVHTCNPTLPHSSLILPSAPCTSRAACGSVRPYRFRRRAR